MPGADVDPRARLAQIREGAQTGRRLREETS